MTPEIQRSFDGDDRIAADLILERLADRTGTYVLRGDYSPAEYKGVLKRCELFVGGRMHAVIGAVSAGTPAAIMQYSHKASGVREMLDLAEYVWNCRAPVAELLQVLDRLWNDRQAVRNRLAATMPELVARAYRLGDVMAEALALPPMRTA